MTWEEQAATLGPAEIVALLAENAKLKRQVEWLQRQLFGRKSEKRLREPDPAQLSLAGILTMPVAPADQPPPPTETVNAYQRRFRLSGAELTDESELRFDDSVPIQEIVLTNPEVAALPPEAYEAIVFGSFLAHWERQTCNMGKHLSHSSPAAEIEAEQLVGAFRRGAPHPPTDEQTGNQGHRDLQVHPIFTVTEQMATPQETFNPAEEQVHGPPITIREGKEVRVQVQPMSHPDHCDRRPSRVGFVRGHPHPPQRRRGAGARLSRSHAAPHDVRSHPRGLSSGRPTGPVRDFIGGIFLDAGNKATGPRMQVGKQVLSDVASIEDRKPTRVHQLPGLGALRAVARRDRPASGHVAHGRKGHRHFCCSLPLLLPPRPHQAWQRGQQPPVNRHQIAQHRQVTLAQGRIAMRRSRPGPPRQLADHSLEQGRLKDCSGLTERAQGGPPHPPALLHLGQRTQLLYASQTADRRRKKIQQQHRRILILKQLAVPGPIPLRSRLMERRQQCPHQPDILEALHDRRRYFPRRALLGLPFRGLLCVHSPTLYETRLHLTNFVPNTIGLNRAG